MSMHFAFAEREQLHLIALQESGSMMICRPYARIADVLSVNVGLELLQIVPGRVSTEVDAHLSYDTQKTVDKVCTFCWDDCFRIILIKVCR